MTVLNTYVPKEPPTVNNATLKIQKNGTDVATFTANQSSDVTANITFTELPTTTGATAGQVLVFNGTSLVWATPSLNITTYNSG